MTETDRPYFISIGTSDAGLVDYDALLREQFQESQEDRHAMPCDAAVSFLNGGIGDTRAALRMLSETGNPTFLDLAKVIQALAKQEGGALA